MMDATTAPDGQVLLWREDIQVNHLGRGFITCFGDTDCQTLSGCDWGVAEDVRRYYKDEVFSTVCLRQWEYVLEKCLDPGN